jgi:hypothetical protein
MVGHHSELSGGVTFQIPAQLSPRYPHPPNSEQGLLSALCTVIRSSDCPLGRITPLASQNADPRGVYKFWVMLRTFAGFLSGLASLRLMMRNLDQSF